MSQTIKGHFDGKVIVPDEPVTMPVGEPLRVVLEVASKPLKPLEKLMDLAGSVTDAPPDMAAQHDHYLYGTDKR